MNKIKRMCNWVCVNKHQFYTLEEIGADKPICPYCMSGKVFLQIDEKQIGNMFDKELGV